MNTDTDTASLPAHEYTKDEVYERILKYEGYIGNQAARIAVKRGLDREELIQASLLYCFETWQLFKGRHEEDRWLGFVQWLRACVLNAASSLRAARWRASHEVSTEIATPGSDDEDRLSLYDLVGEDARQEDEANLRQVMELLQQHPDAGMVIGHYVEGETLVALGEQHGISKQGVGQRLKKAVAWLQGEIGIGPRLPLPAAVNPRMTPEQRAEVNERERLRIERERHARIAAREQECGCAAPAVDDEEWRADKRFLGSTSMRTAGLMTMIASVGGVAGS